MKPSLAGYAAGVVAICAGAAGLRSEPEKRVTEKTILLAPARKEIASVEAEINRIEGETLADVQSRSLDPSQKIILLGKLIFYDQQLSVRENEACAFCHMPETGFTGPVSALNQTTVSYPGSIRTRFGHRNPQTHTYASFAPVLHYNALQGDLVGGAFWDMRATGLRLNSPLAEQALDPPLDPDEMGMIDAACVVYRLSQRPYRRMAEQLWGDQAFDIRWPRDAKTVCDRPGPAPHSDPLPMHLASSDRGVAQSTFDQIAQSIAAYEGSTEVNSFSSKYDYVMAGKVQFTPDEKIGYTLFRSKQANALQRVPPRWGPGRRTAVHRLHRLKLGFTAQPVHPVLSGECA
jgi:cytochrome c peroxidase